MYPSRRILRRMKLITDQKGIINRYLREKSGWDTHIENCKKTIVEFSSGKSGTIAILGSGWLLDVPLDDLLTYFQKVILVDIDHPNQIVNKYKGNSQIELCYADVTGGVIEHVYSMLKSNSFDISSINPTPFASFIKADYFVSLNILNQLDNLIVDAVIRGNSINNDIKPELRKLIQQSHLNYLPKNKSLVISDIEQETTNVNTNITTNNSLLYCDLLSRNVYKKWVWPFDSTGSYITNTKILFNVVAIRM